MAIGWAVKAAEGVEEGKMPTVLGMTTPREVHQAVKAWREVKDGVRVDELCRLAEDAMRSFEDVGLKDWTWYSGL